MLNLKPNIYQKKAFTFIFSLLIAAGIAVLLYLLILPVYPLVKYELFYRSGRADIATASFDENWGSLTSSKKKELPPQKQKDPEDLSDRVIIPRIQVEAPIVRTSNQDLGLSRGAWMLSSGSTPPEGGNTIITAHRFKYLPPSNLTFYLLDKLEAGDKILVMWKEKKYLYQARETKIVARDELSILNQTSGQTLTLFTCHPVFSEKERLVVVAERVKEN